MTKSTDAKSPPTSMLSMLLPGTVTQLNPAFATLTRPITSKVTTTRHAVDYKLLQSGSDAGADASVDAGAGLAFRIMSVVVAPGVAATLSANDSGLLLEIAGVQLSYSFGSPPATNTWTRLEYVITWGANGTGAAQVFVDGTSVFATTGISTLATNTVTSGLIASVGSAVLSGTLTSNARALFDNMTVDY